MIANNINISKHYLQIDILKAFAMISVIIIHTISLSIINKNLIFVFIHSFFLIQAVPLFLLIMGRNSGASFKKHNFNNISDIYTVKYFKERFLRFVLPFVFIFILSLIVGILLDKNLYFGFFTFLGYLPLPGPGNFFISMVFQFIFIFPLIYLFYIRNKKLTIIFSFIVNIIFEIIAANFLLSSFGLEFYTSCVLRYIFLITLGLWLLDNFNPEQINDFFHKKIVIVGSIISILYLTLSTFFTYRFPTFLFLSSNWGSQNILSFFYPLVLFAIGFKVLPSNIKNKIINFTALIGKASYHIFLFQILFFASGITIATFLGKIGLDFVNIYILGLIAIFGNLAICICLGILFFFGETYLSKTIFNKRLLKAEHKKEI